MASREAATQEKPSDVSNIPRPFHLGIIKHRKMKMFRKFFNLFTLTLEEFVATFRVIMTPIVEIRNDL